MRKNAKPWRYTQVYVLTIVMQILIWQQFSLLMISKYVVKIYIYISLAYYLKIISNVFYLELDNVIFFSF